jgi:hypothetical protein
LFIGQRVPTVISERPPRSATDPYPPRSDMGDPRRPLTPRSELEICSSAAELSISDYDSQLSEEEVPYSPGRASTAMYEDHPNVVEPRPVRHTSEVSDVLVRTPSRGRSRASSVVRAHTDVYSGPNDIGNTSDSVKEETADYPVDAGGNERQLNFIDLLSYLDGVKISFEDQPQTYSDFLDTMNKASTGLYVILFPSSIQCCWLTRPNPGSIPPA